MQKLEIEKRICQIHKLEIVVVDLNHQQEQMTNIYAQDVQLREWIEKIWHCQ
ncbi:unnamed protein product [Paramecium octaurelia]|uniref:Uncharacterized protein n=1 Tax=Paramecium octaurelia TaxID=43137 RepID=A0A8S1YR37_PAROT|nr:unnamed protein product [Paramecium octaurelia]CAD8214872.1 unnamed protein product [Paramecium octaurelia]